MNLQAWAQRLGIDPSWFENEEQLAAEIRSRIENNDTEGVSPLAAARARGRPAPQPQQPAPPRPAPPRAARPATVQQGVPMFAHPQQGFVNQFGPGAQGNALQGMYGQINSVMGAEMANRRRVARQAREMTYEDYMARLDHQREMEKLLARIQHEREMARSQMIQAEKARGVVNNSAWYQ
jgi:hypothetical protein